MIRQWIVASSGSTSPSAAADFDEQTAPGEDVTSDQVPNPLDETFRSALDVDDRVILKGVETVIRVGDRPRQSLLVWVQVFCNNHDDGLRTALGAVRYVVGHMIPSAIYSGFDDMD